MKNYIAEDGTYVSFNDGLPVGLIKGKPAVAFEGSKYFIDTHVHTHPQSYGLYPPGYTSDRYRTSRVNMRLGILSLGEILHTGEGTEIQEIDTDGDGVDDTRVFAGGNIDQSRWSNGIAYLGFGRIKIGWDSENIRHFFQNRLAHDGLSWKPLFGFRYPWVDKTSRKDRFFFQFGGIGVF